jgi:hypothetical protein
MARRLPSLGARVRLTPRARRIIVVSFLAVVAFGLAVFMAAWNRACAGNSCPSIAELGAYDPNQASKVYAADGRLITDLGQERRTVVPLAEMSPVVKAAFIATEDKRFYEHHGIDWYRVFGAIRSNLVEMRVAEGFSRISAAATSRSAGSSARPRSPARSRRSTPRTGSSSCISTRSISAIAPSAWRPPPSATSGSRSGT